MYNRRSLSVEVALSDILTLETARHCRRAIVTDCTLVNQPIIVLLNSSTDADVTLTSLVTYLVDSNQQSAVGFTSG